MLGPGQDRQARAPHQDESLKAFIAHSVRCGLSASFFLDPLLKSFLFLCDGVPKGRVSVELVKEGGVVARDPLHPLDGTNWQTN
jgi:hypothetical protein